MSVEFSNPGQSLLSASEKIYVGPERVGYGSWEWVGKDLISQWTQQREIQVLRELNELDEILADERGILFLVKEFPDLDMWIRLPDEIHIVYAPIDRFQSGAEIDLQGGFLSRCSTVILHNATLAKYFRPYCRVELIDHHLKYISPSLPSTRSMDGPILWTGVTSNLPPLVEWVNRHGLVDDLHILSNFPANKIPSLKQIGFRVKNRITLDTWSPENHIAWLGKAKGALDIKGRNFSQRHKPPTKSCDFIASGLPVAMNQNSSPVEWFERYGLKIADPRDRDYWYSEEYWKATQTIGSRLRTELSLPVISNRVVNILDQSKSRKRSVPRRSESRKTRIAVCSLLFNWPSTGGGTVHTAELCEQLHIAGYEVRHFSANFEPWGLGEIREPLPYPLTTLSFIESDWTRDRIKDWFRKAVREFQPDQVIVTDSWNLKPVLAEAVSEFPYWLRLAAQETLCPLNNVKLLVNNLGEVTACPLNQLRDPGSCQSCVRENGHLSGSLHQVERELAGYGSSEYDSLLRHVYQKATGILVVNPQIGSQVAPYCSRVEVIPSGFDSRRFPSPYDGSRHKSADDPKVILFAGLSREFMKGFHILREACRQLWGVRRDFVLWLTEENDSSIKEEYVKCIGWQSQTELPGVMRAADIIVVPTLAEEALGRTAVEAMGAGKPVVASRIGGLPWVVREEETGLLVPPGNPEALASALGRLLDDGATRERLGVEGRKRFEREFTWEVIMKRDYERLFGSPVRSK